VGRAAPGVEDGEEARQGREKVSAATRRLFGKRARLLRKLRRWTQEELAVKAKMDMRQLGAIERGERNVTLDNVAKIAEGLGVEIHQLFLFGADGVGTAADAAEGKVMEALKGAGKEKRARAVAVLWELLR
jgi:transcriptional regulator with XRE-family HTH domain